VKIVVLSDLHYTGEPITDEKRHGVADLLLRRAVLRINRMIRPDLTLLMGDLVNDGADPGAPSLWRRLREIADKLESPYLALPGNHDGDPEPFYQVFDRPPEHYDLSGVRFVSFVDPEEPNWNARRTEADLERITAARQGHAGPLVCLQHTSLFPPGASDCPYSFINADDVVTRMRQAGVTLSISGHYHVGVPLIQSGELAFAICPALCEPPFDFLEITLDQGQIAVTRHSLAMPRELRLFDLHVHTPFAYCSEDMDIPLSLTLANDFGLGGLAFCEHTGQLYFNAPTFWNAAFMTDGIETSIGLDDRMPAYLRKMETVAGPATLIGLEIDADFSGRPVVRDEDRRQAQFALGTIHWLPELGRPQPNVERAKEEYLSVMKRLCAGRIDALAHPFRVLRQLDHEVSASLIGPTVEVLRASGVAAELNFHYNDPSLVFVQRCLEAGVRLTLGSDSHNLSEIGEFAPHLALLRRCGCDHDLERVLLNVDSLPRWNT